MILLDSKNLKGMALALLACIVVALWAALKVNGCGWDYYTGHSVRFNISRDATVFARLPHLPNLSSMKQTGLFSWDEDVGHGEERYEEREQEKTTIDNLWNLAAVAEDKGNLVEERNKLREFISRTRGLREGEWGSPKNLQTRRNSAFDILDALSALDEGSNHDTVMAYLLARADYYEHRPATIISERLLPCHKDKNLRDNAAYLEAAVFYRDGKRIGVDSFDEVARRFPGSEKREAALFMSAVASMKASKCSIEDQSASSAVAQRDQAWESARRGFQQVMREYPGGRYYVDAMGWLAHLWLQAGDRAHALADYYRMLASENEIARAEAVVSIGFARHRTDDSEMAKLEGLIANEPRTAMAYAYHEIYNYAVSHRCSGYYSDERCKPQRSANELGRIAQFATQMMSRYPNAAIGGGFVLRVAEAQLELEHNADAALLARRALALGVRGDERAEALWVAGSAEHRLRRYDTARRALETLVKENPNNRYTEGGRRLLAMLLEDSGNLDGALDVYLALDYRYDIAYFIDVLMTPAQLAAFIDKRPALDHRDELLYALGVRYLRERNWRDARATLMKIRPVGRNADDNYNRDFNNYSLSKIERESPKERPFDPTIPGVRSQWIDQDMRTANDLETLEHQVELAQGDEAKAEALYQVASYQFERSLLFYNPIPWSGIRHYLLDDLNNDGGFRQPGESQLLFDNMQKHDMAANSLPIFLEVARRFPNTRAARDALFSAAVCHERLAEYNNYWRGIYAEGGHAGERMVTYRDVRAAYPKYRFPRGTLGWEPATRTVNRGPAWEPLPKPKPRPSRLARCVDLLNGCMNASFRLLNRMISDIEFTIKQGWLSLVLAAGWVFHWLWVVAMCGWVWFLWRRTREARELMRESLAGCNRRPAEERSNSHGLLEVTTSASVLNRFLHNDLRAEWLENVYDLEYKLRQVLQDKQGLSVVGFYLASHGMFALLLVRLLVNW